MQKVVFLDRDGVLNQDPPHYAYRLDQMEMIPGVDEAVKLLKDAGYFLVVVSNQSGVARGYYPEGQISIFNEALRNEIKKKGGDIDVFKYCPHHPEAPLEKYRVDCTCRKPKPGMIFDAAKEYNLDLKTAYFVGDQETDVETAKNAGIKPIFVLSGQGRDKLGKINQNECLIAEDLLDAVKRYILPNGNSE